MQDIDLVLLTTDRKMYDLSSLTMTRVTVEVIHLLQTFSVVFFRTAMLQLIPLLQTGMAMLSLPSVVINGHMS